MVSDELEKAISELERCLLEYRQGDYTAARAALVAAIEREVEAARQEGHHTMRSCYHHLVRRDIGDYQCSKCGYRP